MQLARQGDGSERLEFQEVRTDIDYSLANLQEASGPEFLNIQMCPGGGEFSRTYSERPRILTSLRSASGCPLLRT